jgi:hypothetical protein
MLERHLTLRDGERVLIRPLLPKDAALYPDFLSDVSRSDLRLRFFSAMRECAFYGLFFFWFGLDLAFHTLNHRFQ